MAAAFDKSYAEAIQTKLNYYPEKKEPGKICNADNQIIFCPMIRQILPTIGHFFQTRVFRLLFFSIFMF
jgi:hypothetical protein